MPFFNLNGQGRPPIRLKQVGSNEFQLLTGFCYRDPTTGKTYRIRAHNEGQNAQRGNQTDLASIPFPLWGLIASYGHQTLPALLHDRLCERAQRAATAGNRRAAFARRREADRIFRVALREEGVPRLRARIMWAGVSFGRYKDFARLRFVLLVSQLLVGLGFIYCGVLILGGWKVRWLPSVEGWKIAVVMAVVPAVAAALWVKAFLVPLIGSYVVAVILPPALLMLLVAFILWLPDSPELLWRRITGLDERLRGPVPTALRPRLFL